MIKNLTIRDQKLRNLKLQYDKKTPFSERLVEKASDIWVKSYDYDEHNPFQKVSYGIKSTIDGVKFFAYGLGAIAISEVENKKRKKKLLKILGCQDDELAIDINEFRILKAKTKYYGDTYRYDASTRKDSLGNIEAFFGDVHLEALDDMHCLHNLKSVWGSIYFSRATDLSGLSIEIVNGDIHGEHLQNANGLENLMYVGGTIYYQNEAYTLDQFQQQILGRANNQKCKRR